MKIGITTLLVILLSYAAQTQTQTPVYLSQTITNANCKGFYRYLPADYATTTKSYPVIIWVHGADLIGQGNATDLPLILRWGVPKIINAGGFPSSFLVGGVNYSFIVISPQFMGWPNATNLNAMINYVSNNYRVDAERIYLMGISAGGGGIWDYASASVANSDRVAAMIPFSGTLVPTQTLANRIAASKLPVWAFHNTYDGTVPVANSRNWVSYINSYVPAPSPAAKLTEFPVRSSDAVVAHESWSTATLPTYKPQGINIYEWMLQYKRRTAIVNTPPVARAGNDTSVALPATINLNGSASTDADGMIAIYRWRKVSGPGTYSFSDSTAANTTVSNLSPGTYQFELTVTDNGGVTGTDNMTVNVYAAFAPGVTQRVLIDVGSATQTTSPSINGLYWNNITDARPGVRLSNARTTLNLPSGISVQVVNRLDGTYSTSSDGTITGNTTGIVGDYPASATTDLALIHNSATNGLWRILGMSASKVYTIKFWGSRTGTTALRTAEIKRADETTWKSYTATSNTNYNNAAVFTVSGQTTMDFNIRTKSGSEFSALDILDISFVEEIPAGPPPNKTPVANAGANAIFQLPQDSILLNGCASADTESAALKFKWKKISGPASFQIVNDSVCQPRIRGLIAGSYQFELTVADTGNLVARDTVNITVLPLPNKAPVANAGANVTIQLPVDSTLLNGCTSADIEGAALKFKWTKISGPGNFQISNDTSCQTVLRGLIEGNYQFQLVVTDTGNLIGRDTVNITIESLPNNLPVANAGPDHVHNLPPDSLQLNGSGSDDDGTITKYKWRKISGPSIIFSNDSIAAAIATSLLPGTYMLELTVTDNRSGTAKDSMMLTVHAPPLANAGTDTSFTGISANIQLDGSASSSNPTGRTLTYNWNIISGNGGTLENNHDVNPIFTSGAPGQFGIVLTVTDDNQLTDTDTLLISILAPNILPVANAGPDLVHSLPPTSLQLNGSGTDEDGTITKYKWRKISGPAISFANDSIANPVASSLVPGIYLLELSVTDNRNDIAKDTILLITIAPPVANAGNDTSTVGASANIQLDGSASSSNPTGRTLTYNWNIFSGTGGTLENSNDVNPIFTSGIPGHFSIVLTVTDDNQLTDTDTLLISILAPNILPVANAGPDLVHNLPPNSLQLNGSGTDEDGTIITYKWRKISGPVISFVNDSIANPVVSSLVSGTYTLTMSVTDDRNGTANDTILLIVNAPPLANAGTDIFITGTSANIELNGTASSDPEGSALSYDWRIISGAGATLNNTTTAAPSFTSNAAGIYTIELKVTDEHLSVDLDTMQIVIEPANILPVANAGPDLVHNLPPNSLQLTGSGTDEDGIITKYKWRKISGPSGSFVNDSIASPVIASLVSGIYTLELAVTDSRNGIARDTILLIVNAPPVANAGADIFITGTSANIELNGTASSDPEGSVFSYEWRIIAGTGATLNNAATATPSFASSAEGFYAIELRITDEYLSVDLDTVMVVITAANILPVANAGPDVVHNLPPNSLQLNGSGNDEDGTIIRYKWRKISGPSMSFVNDSIASPQAVSLVSGIYALELAVTDNRGDMSKDTMQLIVNAPPVANAGADVSITASSANIQLNGAASQDPEGAPLTYHWSIISGTGGILDNSNLANPIFSTATIGQYIIVLTVTDVYYLANTDTLLITITAPNILPIANAGADKLIHLPPNTTTLNGSASFDSDGSIAAYKWRKISGPAMAFSNDAVASPSANALTYGVYSFELVVTDNKGATAKDTMILTVNNPPVANAGANASITLPANTVTVSGAGSSDVDGSIALYSWRQVSGAAANISSPSSALTGITFTTADTYRFELTVTDNRGASVKDSVDITVLPAPTVITKTFRVNIYGGTNPYNNTQWNNWNVTGSLTSARFNYDDGTASNVTATLTASAEIKDNGTTYATTATVCPPQVLRYSSANTSTRTLTFSGMTNTKTYDLEFYGSRANTGASSGNSSIFQIGNRYDTISTDNNLNDIARFTNVVPDASGRITVTISRIGTWTYLSGFVVAENTAVSSLITSASRSVTEVAALAEKPATESQALVVHPNPATDIVYVNIPADISGPYKMSVVNMNGQTVLQKAGTKSSAAYTDKIDIGNLPKGMYLLNISIQNKNMNSTIVKL